MNWITVFLSCAFALSTAKAVQEPNFAELRKQGSDLLRQGKIAASVQLFAEGLEGAQRKGLPGEAGRFLINIGATHYLSFQNKKALEAYLEARRLGEANQDWELRDVAITNLATIFARMGDWQRAYDTATQLDVERWRGSARQLPQFLQHLAIYEYRLRRFSASDRHFALALESAEAIADWQSVGRIWDNWGQSYLERGNLEAAERCLLSSFRIRALRRDPEKGRLHLHLARLALRQGDLGAAENLIGQAVQQAHAGLSNYPIWDAYLLKGEMRERRGDLAGALKAYRQALEWARRWRLQILPADTLQMVAANRLSELTSAFVRCAYREYERTGSRAALGESFAAVEENRAAGLRMGALRPSDYEDLFPESYWETLAELHRAEVGVLAGRVSRLARDRLQTAALEIEGKIGLTVSQPATSPQLRHSEVQRQLDPDEALFVYLLGDSGAFAWALTRDNSRMTAMPPPADLEKEIKQFRLELASGIRTDAGSRIFSKIFGEFFSISSTKRFWTVVLDGPMFDLPISALPLPSGEPIVKRHAVSLSPSAFSLRPGQMRPGRVAFAALADPVYNSADSRIAAIPAAISPRPQLQLNRLPGTQSEIAASARIWAAQHPSSEIRMFTGKEATRERLFAASASQPSVLHLATHVVANGDRALLAFGLRPGGDSPELVGAEDIASRRKNLGLVVMTGCASGRGKPIAGAGLQGLARAWILAGAQGVVASQSPLPDDSGELIQSFYRHLPGGPRPAGRHQWALALRDAQLEMLRVGGWRSAPTYWSAYSLTARN